MNPRDEPEARETVAPPSAAPPDADPARDAATHQAPAPAGRPPPALSARVASALARPFRGRSARPAGSTSGGEPVGPGRATTSDATTYDEALRLAFRSAVPLNPARPTPHPAPDPLAPAETAAAKLAPDTATAAARTIAAGAIVVNAAAGMAVPVDTARDGVGLPVDSRRDDVAGGDDARVSGVAVGPGVALEPTAPELGVAVGPGVALEPTAPEPAAPTSPSPAPPPVGGPPSASPAGWGRPVAGPTAPVDLLEVPGNVATTVDDFFTGVVRRAERRP
jgi:hypothetical protein